MTAAYLGPASAIAPVARRRAYELMRAWSKRELDRLGIELEIEDRSGFDGRRGALFVDLHQQTLLTALIYPQAMPYDVRLIVNVEFAALPLIGWTTVGLGAVPIVRQRPSQAKAALDRVVQRLRGGESFGISIEGVRSRDGSLSPYKKGPAVLAIEAQADIIPYMSFGEYRLWPRGEWRIRPGRVQCVAFPPIPTRGLTYEDRDALVERLWNLARSELAARGYSAR